MEKKNFVQFYFLLAKSIARYGFSPKFLFLRQVPNIVGRASGYYHAFNKKKPAWLVIAEDLFNVKYYK